MRVRIEKNSKFGAGYQIRVSFDNGEDSIIDYTAYTLKKAVMMAKHAVDIINRRGEGTFELKDVLEIDKDSILSNKDYDGMSGEMAQKLMAENESKAGSLNDEILNIDQMGKEG